MMSWIRCCFGDNCDNDSILERKRTITNRSLRNPSSFSAVANKLTCIFEDLKCPICFNVCVPPIHNCINGHIVCDNCRQRGNVTSCPTCRESLLGARNYFAENFILNYAQQCRYASQGCEHLRLKGCSMKPHEEKCIFRPVKCIVELCGLDIPYKNFLGHLDYAHKASGTNKLPTTLQFKYSPKNSKKTKWLPFYIQAFGSVYYVMMQKVGGNFWLWAYSQTSKESDELEYNHYAYIKLKHPEKKITHSWHGPVYPIRTPFKVIMNEGCCFILPEMIMKNFVLEGVLNFTVDIRKTPRRNLKDVKSNGDDSDTAVASSHLPIEYNRPPSFYEPTLPSPPAVPPRTVPPNMTDGSLQRLDENGNVLNSVSSLPQRKPGYPDIISRPKLRTAAIGIPGGYPSLSLSGSVASSMCSVTVPNFFDNPPAEMTFKNEEEDMQDKIFNDKIPTRANSVSEN